MLAAPKVKDNKSGGSSDKPKPKKKAQSRDDFMFGGVLGEGAYARVVIAEKKADGTV